MVSVNATLDRETAGPKYIFFDIYAMLCMKLVPLEHALLKENYLAKASNFSLIEGIETMQKPSSIRDLFCTIFLIPLSFIPLLWGHHY